MITAERILKKFLDKKVKYFVSGGSEGTIAGQEEEGTLMGFDDKGIIVTIDHKIDDLPERYYLIPWDASFTISASGIGELIKE